MWIGTVNTMKSKEMKFDNIKIAIIGLGCVGLPMAIKFSKKFDVVSYDTNPIRINELKNGYDATGEIQSSILNKSNCEFTINEGNLADCNVYINCEIFMRRELFNI